VTVVASTVESFIAPYLGQPSPIEVPWTRVDLADLFAACGATTGAEIGVERGEYSETLLLANPQLSLLCVDAWRAYKGYREHVTQAKLDVFYEATCQRLAPYPATIVRAFSVDAARAVPDRSLDFVYLDAAHDLRSVIVDLAVWTPKVKAGGLIAGHDYGRSSVGHVREAVQAWTQAYRVAPWFVLTGDRSPSWMWVQRG
jgi:hypothetical protein